MTNLATYTAVQEEGFDVGVRIVKQLLKEHNFRRRKALKTKAGKQTKNRDDQFKKIGWLKESYHQNDNPVLSMDSKKKEPIGNLYREGSLYTQEVIKVFDHDFYHLTHHLLHCDHLYPLESRVQHVPRGTPFTRIP